MSIDVEGIRRRHTSTRMKRCRYCGLPWPCEMLEAADEIEALRNQDALAIARRVLTAGILGEGVHTALRKGCDDGHHAYRAINEMPDAEWHRAMEFVATGLLGYIEHETAAPQPVCQDAGAGR